MAESTGINTDGFTNYTEIIQHLQTGSLTDNKGEISILFFLLLQFGIIITISTKVLVDQLMMKQFQHIIPKVIPNNIIILIINNIITNIPDIKIGRIIIILVDLVVMEIIHVVIIVELMMDIGHKKEIDFYHIVQSIVL
jgi:hypothetical protein